MLIYPAIDIVHGKAVRLFKGDYDKMTVYSDNPPEIAEKFRDAGAKRIHLVDLEGAKNGDTPNFETVMKIKQTSGLFCEIGGGIRDMDTIEKYVSGGIDRVILGTAAVINPGFVEKAVQKYGEKIAVGIDIKDGMVAIKGWTEKSEFDAMEFTGMMQDQGVKTMICTDICKHISCFYLLAYCCYHFTYHQKTFALGCVCTISAYHAESLIKHVHSLSAGGSTKTAAAHATGTA